MTVNWQRRPELLQEEETKQDLKSVAKGKGMSDKVTKLVVALKGMGFKESQSLQGATFGRGNLEAALEWLCMNVPEDQLPRYVAVCRRFGVVVWTSTQRVCMAVSSTLATSSWMSSCQAVVVPRPRGTTKPSSVCTSWDSAQKMSRLHCHVRVVYLPSLAPPVAGCNAESVCTCMATGSSDDVPKAEVLLHAALLERAGVSTPAVDEDEAVSAEDAADMVDGELDVLSAIYGDDCSHSVTPAGTYVVVKLGSIKGIRGVSALEVVIPPPAAGTPPYPSASPIVWFVNGGVPPKARLAITVELAKKAAELQGELVVHELVTWARAKDGAAAAVVLPPPRLPLLVEASATDDSEADASAPGGGGAGAARHDARRGNRGNSRHHGGGRNHRRPQGPSPAVIRRLNTQLKQQMDAKLKQRCVSVCLCVSVWLWLCGCVPQFGPDDVRVGVQQLSTHACCPGSPASCKV